MPTLHTDTIIERYTDMPITQGIQSFNDPAFPYDRCIRSILMPRPALGEIWDIYAEVHVTNEDLRDRGYGLHLTSEIIIGPSEGNSRHYNGIRLLEVVRANGTFNVGVEAHHGLITRRGLIEWTQDKLDYIETYPAVYIKFMIWSGSTQAQSGARCEITPERGQLKCLRYAP